jgi:hypothetical protein
MKPIKFVLLAIGALAVIAVFLPFFSMKGLDLSLWKLKEVKSGPTYMILLASLALAGVAGLGVSKKKFGRGLAAVTAVLGVIIAFLTIAQFEPEAPFGKVGGTGAKILLFGGVAAVLASIVALIKPDRGA